MRLTLTMWMCCGAMLCLVACDSQPAEPAPAAEPEVPAAEPEAPAEAEAEAEPEADPSQPTAEELPVAEDFEAEVASSITTDNYDDELDAIAKELDAEE